MRFKPEPTPNSLINVHMPMMSKTKQKRGIRFDCPDKQCTVCTSYLAGLTTDDHNEGMPEDFVVDRTMVQKNHRLIQA